MIWEPCVSCARLTKCGDVDAFRISAGEGCSLHETVHEGVVRARLRIVDDFGASAIPTKQNVKDGVIVMGAETMVRKVTLRSLGYRLGVVPRGSESFKLKEEELFNLISPQYPNIRSMSQEDVEKLVDLHTGGGSGAAAPPSKVEEEAPPAKAPKAPPVQQEPEADEESDEPEEDAPKPAAKRGPAARKPAASAPQSTPAPAPRLEQQPEQVAPPRKAPVRPGAPAAKQAAAPSESGPSNTARLEEMLTVIGTAGDARDEKINTLTVEIAKLTKLVKSLSEDIRVIDSYLTYQYNGTVGASDAVTQLSDVDPWVE